MDSRSRKLHSRGGLEHLPRCISLIAEAARRSGLAQARHAALEAAAREAYLAIVQGDQRETRRGQVEVEVAWDGESVSVRLTHAGSGLEQLFDAAPMDPRVDVMRRTLDEVSYARGTRDGHQLLLRVHVQRESSARAATGRVAARRTSASR